MFSFFKKKQPKEEELDEFSTSFDSPKVRSFLEQIAPLIESGFAKKEIDQVCALVDSLPHDGEETLHFQIQHSGKPTPLHIHVFMDDINTPSIYFFTSTELVQQLDREFDSFSGEDQE